MVIRRTLATLLISILAAGGAAVVTTPAAAAGGPIVAQPGQPPNCYPVYWRFVNRYNQNPAAFGCAVGWEFGRDGGVVQDFVNGQMAWSPRQGDGMIVSAYHYTYWTDWGLQHGISFRYNTSNPFNYDRWLIRLDRNGVNIGQPECIANYWTHPCDRYGGSWTWSGVAPGVYRFVAEGCDYGAWSGHTCRQGWTNPIWVWF